MPAPERCIISLDALLPYYLNFGTAMSHSRRVTLRSLLHIISELFFAILPLIVLGAFWPDGNDSHPVSFYRGPEWSMTACILYGLSLTRFLEAKGCATPDHGPAIATISIIPLLGVIISVILISKTSHITENNILLFGQFLNLLVSTILFVLLGGYGASRSE